MKKKKKAIELINDWGKSGGAKSGLREAYLKVNQDKWRAGGGGGWSRTSRAPPHPRKGANVNTKAGRRITWNHLPTAKLPGCPPEPGPSAPPPAH